QACVFGDLRLEDRSYGLGGDVGNMERAFLSPTLDKGNYFHLVVVATGSRRLLADVAPVGFIDFDRTAVATERSGAAVIHCLTNTMAHEPRRFVADVEYTVYLVGAHTLFAGAHEERGHQPFIQRYLAALKHRAHGYRELVAALVALIKAG